MINKVFKTILIFSLCLGITIPSNAAGVDVSDGSAFITKAEMSYQLNNLSNRMTQLENSLDSKIDKLVSSYLTRNGIWNGVKQTLITTNYTIPAKGTFTTNTSTNDYSVTGPIKQLFKANKSGMAYVNESWKIIDGAAPNNWRYGGYITSKSTGNGSTDHKIFLTVYFKDITTDTLLVSWLLGSANGAVNSADERTYKRYSVYIPVPGSELNNSTVFFVNKDDTYGFYYYCGLFLAGYYIEPNTYTFGDNSVVLKFKDANVY